MTALHYAVQTRYVAGVQRLLNVGANPLALNNQGLTPLELLRSGAKESEGSEKKLIEGIMGMLVKAEGGRESQA